MNQVRVLWEINWYNLDCSLKVGERAVFSFAEPDVRHRPRYDLQFRYSIEMDPEDDYHWATVESIEHPRFGTLDEVDTTLNYVYTFRFRDGRWITVDVEQGQGTVRAASPDFVIDRDDPDWSSCQIGDKRRDCYYEWDLDVVLADLAVSDYDELWEYKRSGTAAREQRTRGGHR